MTGKIPPSRSEGIEPVREVFSGEASKQRAELFRSLLEPENPQQERLSKAVIEVLSLWVAELKKDHRYRRKYSAGRKKTKKGDVARELLGLSEEDGGGQDLEEMLVLAADPEAGGEGFAAILKRYLDKSMASGKAIHAERLVRNLSRKQVPIAGKIDLTKLLSRGG